MPKNESAVSPLVGPGFRQVPEGTLLEFGDELQDADGVFRAVPLNFVGRPVQARTVARRVARAAQLNAY